MKRKKNQLLNLLLSSSLSLNSILNYDDDDDDNTLCTIKIDYIIIESHNIGNHLFDCKESYRFFFSPLTYTYDDGWMKERKKLFSISTYTQTFEHSFQQTKMFQVDHGRKKKL